MSGDPHRLKVVLCWHMHQPDYRGPDASDYQLPWVYLHGTKDYCDMAAHLEDVPDARAVVNFAPVLLEQIADYAEQIEVWLDTGKRIRDPLLAALAGPGLPLDMQGRRDLILACMRANDKHLINRFPVFRELVGMAKCGERDQHSAMYFSDQFLVDLLVWYHLAWMGESVRENDLRIASLEKKQRGYTNDDRRQLMAVIGEQVASIIPRYRQLAEEGRIELSVTPYAHPIVPLLIDIESAREAMPEMHLPELQAYPGGEARARWHIRKGVETFERHFGFRPKGCWPSEGGVCEETLRMLEEEGFVWAASGQQVLHNSMMVSARGAPVHEPWLHSAYRVHEGKLNCFFRDDGLSDLIGFTYADWHADDAVGNLVQHLENIAALSADDPDAVVSIILDGENAWEYYPFNGSYFLSALYRRLAQHPDLELTTFSECIAAQTAQPPALNRLVAGSWVYGTFSTWIGDPDKNRAWDMLGDAKRTYDRVIESGRLSPEQRREVEIQLSTCEGSDWFWWFGDYNPADTVSDFEGLYRRQLSHLYRMLGEPRPDYLGKVFARGSGAPTMGGVMKRN
jgi:alpha-amylase/alpha-mannosidase (GH57 family)